MSREYLTIANNVCTDIQDTSSSMVANVKRYINRRYMQIMRAVNFEIFHSDYTISVVVGTADYDLPTDFKVEIACIDQTNNRPLDRTDFSYFQNEDTEALTTQGGVSKYIIYTNEANEKQIKFVAVPDSAITVALPYISVPVELSGNTDIPFLNCEDLLEAGARADAWRYKRQFMKAQTEEALFNLLFMDFITANNAQNMSRQFTLKARDGEMIIIPSVGAAY
jgi:hypothetical protein